jgi:hypothetical protein
VAPASTAAAHDAASAAEENTSNVGGIDGL